MKKIILGLIAAAIVAMVAVPAMAATQWNFGASLRYGTFWTEQDAGKGQINDLQGGGAALDSDGILDWSAQGNSQIQMYMKSDSLEGYIELGYNVNDNKVTAREYWGKYKFNDMAYIAIGQQHQLFSQFISSQVWGEDLGMNGLGTAFKPPTPKIAVGYGGFAFALAQPYDGRLQTAVDLLLADIVKQFANPATPTEIFGANNDADIYFPQIQASYEYMAETWRVKLAGAYQHIKVNKPTGTYDYLTWHFDWPSNNVNINSWLIGLDGDVNFGPLYLAAAASVGQNWSDAGWNDETGCISGMFTDNYLQKYMGILGSVVTSSVPTSPPSSGKVRMKWKDTTSIMASVVGAYQFTEALRFEAGAGYRYDDNDLFAKSGNIWNVYMQAQYTVAPGFNIIPEVGYIDMGKHVMDKTDNGHIWYVGTQWRMDF